MTDQANQTTEIIDAMKALTSISQQINNATMSLTEVTKNISLTGSINTPDSIPTVIPIRHPAYIHEYGHKQLTNRQPHFKC